MTAKFNRVVKSALARPRAISAHPEADVLAAYAENTLLKRERATVIAHLADCADCRESLALAFPAEVVGVVVDTYHVWWDARLHDEIARAAGRIVSYQVCDWVLPLPEDALLGRGHLGDGVIDFGPISASVAAAGYEGYVEVEIFNADVWAGPADETAATVRERFAAALGS